MYLLKSFDKIDKMSNFMVHPALIRFTFRRNIPSYYLAVNIQFIFQFQENMLVFSHTFFYILRNFFLKL